LFAPHILQENHQPMALQPVLAEVCSNQIAYELFEHVAGAEGRDLYDTRERNVANRTYMLATYRECRRVVVSGSKPQ
jgi:hypothetical protein